MSRYIDADRVMAFWKPRADKHEMYDAMAFYEDLDLTPTADVRKVVRCRGCSWHKPNDYFSGLICTNPYFEAEYGYISVDEEFYCANGTMDEVKK